MQRELRCLLECIFMWIQWQQLTKTSRICKRTLTVKDVKKKVNQRWLKPNKKVCSAIIIDKNQILSQLINRCCHSKDFISFFFPRRWFLKFDASSSGRFTFFLNSTLLNHFERNCAKKKPHPNSSAVEMNSTNGGTNEGME